MIGNPEFESRSGLDLPSVVIAIPSTGLHRLSIDEYHQLVASGGLDEDSRVELIDGLLVDMSPRSPQHETAISWLIDWLIDSLDRSEYQFRVTAPLTIGTSEAAPDISVINRPAPTGEHPNHARLVVEVAVSSKERDLVTKPRLYAPAVDEYWVVDLEQRRVVVHRDPGPDGYGDVTQTPSGEPLQARAIELGILPSGDLFAAALARSS
jgi:Uma2 family endonuclease